MSLWIIDDFRAALRGDPALKGRPFASCEVILYQGVHALILHRLAHALWNMNVPFLPRLISQISRFFTGLEIHPGAKIGQGVFFDHGSGVVIGETAEIGNNVIIYHQVTLGGTSLNPGKRHPTIGDDVIIGAGAKLFGPLHIGNNSQIGGGAVVTKNVPPDSVVVGNPARVVRQHGVKVTERVDTMHLPDPIRKRIVKLARRVRSIERKVEQKG
ncbi:MAG: serine O-acetyltransferase [bacterium]|nr:serine O-acetyltransferase [bacterium]